MEKRTMGRDEPVERKTGRAAVLSIVSMMRCVVLVGPPPPKPDVGAGPSRLRSRTLGDDLADAFLSTSSLQRLRLPLPFVPLIDNDALPLVCPRHRLYLSCLLPTAPDSRPKLPDRRRLCSLHFRRQRPTRSRDRVSNPAPPHLCQRRTYRYPRHTNTLLLFELRASAHARTENKQCRPPTTPVTPSPSGRRSSLDNPPPRPPSRSLPRTEAISTVTSPTSTLSATAMGTGASAGTILWERV